MKLIESNVEPLIQEEGLRGIYKQIERCGRTCYKSEDHITEDSCDRFVQAMIKNGHTAMLEHGTVYLTIPDTPNYSPTRYLDNPYSCVKINRDADGKWCWFITTNYRVLVENGFLDDLEYLTEPTAYHAKRYCFRIICDRGVSHEIVRHRHMSFVQESTRYCNYSKDKFGNELTFIRPSWYTPSYKAIDDPKTTVEANIVNQDKKSYIFEQTLIKVERHYMELLAEGLTAQEARDVLPNALKTEICVTGFKDDWDHFLDLRYKGKTGKPHPDMYKIAEAIYKHFSSD